MEKRTFLKTGLLLTIGAVVSPLIKACKPGDKAAKASAAGAIIPPPKLRRTEPFSLPPLPYAATALEPNIDKMTMEIHHGKHHQGYVNKLNTAVTDTAYATYELDDIIARVTTADSEKNVRNNAGGHWNHSLFWEIMTPGGSAAPSGQLAASINASFGSFDGMKTEFSKAASSVFGSGWAWLCVGKDKGLFISTTPNQDNPMMLQIVDRPGTPILGLDVWEHAYYLKHQNKRGDYIDTFFKVINWPEVARRFDKAMFG